MATSSDMPSATAFTENSRPANLAETRLWPAKERRVRTLLVVGFVLLIVLLGADGFVGVRSIYLIRRSVATLIENHFRNVSLIDEVQRAHSALGSILYGLASGHDKFDPASLQSGVAGVEASLSESFSKISGEDPGIEIWRDVERSSAALTAEVRRVLAKATPEKVDLVGIDGYRARLRGEMARLVAANHQRAEETNVQIRSITSNQVAEDVLLLTGCLFITGLCACLVLPASARIYFRMTRQSEELQRVS